MNAIVQALLRIFEALFRNCQVNLGDLPVHFLSSHMVELVSKMCRDSDSKLARYQGEWVWLFYPYLLGLFAPIYLLTKLPFIIYSWPRLCHCSPPVEPNKLVQHVRETNVAFAGISTFDLSFPWPGSTSPVFIHMNVLYRLAGFGHQDAYEFFTHLVNTMHEEMLRMVMWKVWDPRAGGAENSMISDIFGGITKSSLVCTFLPYVPTICTLQEYVSSFFDVLFELYPNRL